ncbi:MAG: tail fiber domain-containing protein [Planctomycetes bacterium]|nr:tail fiber domain-containing protein [Planctomycetota bacterium]
MKNVKILFVVILAIVVVNSHVFGEQWSGLDDTTSPISRIGKVGIGRNSTNNPEKTLEVKVGDQDGIRIESSGIPRLELDSRAGNNLRGNWVLFTAPSDGDFGIHDDNSGHRRLTITNDGNIGIGTNNPKEKLHVVGDIAIGYDKAARIERDNGRDSLRYYVPDGSAHFFCRIGRKILQIGGTPERGIGAFIDENGSYSKRSSKETKKDIFDISTEEALKALEHLNPVRYKYKGDRSKNEYLGFIAEELPELLATADHKRVIPLGLITVLAKVVKDQQKIIEEQKDAIEKIVVELESMKKKESKIVVY